MNSAIRCSAAIALVACSASAPRVSPVIAVRAADAAPAAPVSVSPPATDEVDCVRDAARHAVRFILDQHAAMVAERLGRAPTPADYAEPTTCLSSTKLPDLDGDGVDETEISEGCSWGTQAALRLLYLSNQGCTRFAGDVIDGELVPMDSATSGVGDLEATWSNGCAGQDFRWTHYRWNGKRYRAIDEAVCYLCDDPEVALAPPPGANRHPRCQQR